MKGKIIVFEGTDGSGKETQSNLFCDHLKKSGFQYKKIDFPRYGNPSAYMVEEYLNGKFGENPSDVNAYTASLFYALDRFASYKEDWGSYYENGGLIVADRYTTSNAIHQASKLKEADCSSFLDWLFKTEYNLLGIPEPDLVFYLDMPIEVSKKLMRRREKEAKTTADIHEKDEEYLKNCRERAYGIIGKYGWVPINCSEDSKPRHILKIHADVWDASLPLISKLNQEG